MSSPPAKRQKTGAANKEKKSIQLYNRLKLEGPPRKADTGRFVDRDNRLPEEASKLNLWADAFWNAGCRTTAEIAADELAAASSTQAKTPPETPPAPLKSNVTYTHNYIHLSPPSLQHYWRT